MKTPDDERLAWLSDVSELTSILTHEFNNTLNGMLLHIAVLKQGAGKELAAELDVIREQGNNAAKLIKKLQQYNGKRRAPLGPVDLNAIVRETVESFKGSAQIQLSLEPTLPMAHASATELRRLVELLLEQSVAAMAPQAGAISIRTSQESRRVLLRIEDTGPRIADDDLPSAFEPFHVVRPGGNEAGLALCHTIARRLQGSLRAENLTPNGVVFVVELSAAKR